MNHLFTPLLFVILLCCGGVYVMGKTHFFRRAFTLGVQAWSGWLPVVAGLLASYVLISNLVLPTTLGSLFYLGFFSKLELLILSGFCLLFFAGYANLLGCLATIYLLQRISFSVEPSMVSSGVSILLGCLTIVAVLGDRIPWVQSRQGSFMPNRIREILVLGTGLVSMVLIFFTLMQAESLAGWLHTSFDIEVASGFLMVFLILLFIGWLGIMLSVTRHVSMTVALLPTLLIISYMSDLPPYTMTVIFTAMVGLSFSNSDSRQFQRI